MSTGTNSRSPTEVPRELSARAVKMIKCSYTPKYSPVIKKFALTLHLHSPAAYRYDMYYVLCIAVYLDFWRGGGVISFVLESGAQSWMVRQDLRPKFLIF